VTEIAGLEMQFGDLSLKRCRYGWMLYSGPIIGKCFELYGEYSEAEVSLMRSVLKPGDTVVDVGANIGDLTVPLSRIVGESGRVYAIESNPGVFNVLCGNLALNGILNTKPLNAFVATSVDVDTGSAVWGPSAYVGSTWAPHFVAIDALDLAGCALIKVDVDGKELDVLRSAEMTIERFRPILYFENDVRSASPDLLEFVLQTLGYRLYWHPAPVFSAENFFGNPINHWSKNVISLMVLGIPRERPQSVPTLAEINDKSDWPEWIS
jgi:FkbM family methyltransferase